MPVKLQLHLSLSVDLSDLAVRTKFSPDCGACEITLNRPDKLNALKLNMSPGLSMVDKLALDRFRPLHAGALLLSLKVTDLEGGSELVPAYWPPV